MLYRCLMGSGKKAMLKKFASQRQGSGYTPLETYFTTLYNAMRGNQNVKVQENLFHRLPKIIDFFLSELGADLTQAFQPFNPKKPEDNNNNNNNVNALNQNTGTYQTNILGLYEVTDVQAVNEQEDNNDSFSDISSES